MSSPPSPPPPTRSLLQRVKNVVPLARPSPGRRSSSSGSASSGSTASPVTIRKASLAPPTLTISPPTPMAGSSFDERAEVDEDELRTPTASCSRRNRRAPPKLGEVDWSSSPSVTLGRDEPEEEEPRWATDEDGSAAGFGASLSRFPPGSGNRYHTALTPLAVAPTIVPVPVLPLGMGPPPGLRSSLMERRDSVVSTCSTCSSGSSEMVVGEEADLTMGCSCAGCMGRDGEVKDQLLEVKVAQLSVKPDSEAPAVEG